MKKEFTIGVSAIVAVLILVFGINYLKGINMFQPSNHYDVVYTDVAGLAQSAPVSLNGYKVGIVRELRYEYNNPGHIRVSLDLDDELKLAAGTVAEIVTDMLGTTTINLHIPAGNKYLEPGAELTPAISQGLVQNLQSEMLPQVVNLLPKVDSIMISVNKVVSNPALIKTVESLDRIAANIESSTRNIKSFSSTLPYIANDARATMTNFNTISTDMKQITAELKDLPVDTTMQNVLRATEELKVLLAQLNNPNSTLGALTHDRSLYNNLNSSAASLDSLLRDIKKNPKRYVTIKIF